MTDKFRLENRIWSLSCCQQQTQQNPKESKRRCDNLRSETGNQERNHTTAVSLCSWREEGVCIAPRVNMYLHVFTGGVRAGGLVKGQEHQFSGTKKLTVCISPRLTFPVIITASSNAAWRLDTFLSQGNKTWLGLLFTHSLRQIEGISRWEEERRGWVAKAGEDIEKENVREEKNNWHKYYIRKMEKEGNMDRKKIIKRLKKEGKSWINESKVWPMQKEKHSKTKKVKESEN